MNSAETDLPFRVRSHLQAIYDPLAYPSLDHADLARRLLVIMGLDRRTRPAASASALWDQSTVLAITYGDSLQREGEYPLKTLKRFFDDHLADTLSGVHILPFFPYSSDDGFSVINYTQVNDALGDWGDIEAIAGHFDLMADLVINHCSARGQWFENFKQGKDPGRDYFITLPPTADTSAVVRPRTSPLLAEVDTLAGKQHVWCTFSHDQVDLNFANPAVLCEIVDIVRLYLERGARALRLDAVAFVWKQANTPCINHPKAHEIVRLLRTLVDHHTPGALIITETNVPSHENLSYFGNGNEAHMVYNFSLPPLLVNALLTGNCSHLKEWQMSLPPVQAGTTYFNFLASHDGIGLRPVEGLLTAAEIDTLIRTLKGFGALVSWRTSADGEQNPYEVNVALFDALKGTIAGPDEWQIERFLCAHAIMLALEGVPGVYIHSLLATGNDSAAAEHTGHNRAINRHKWDCDQLEQALDDPQSPHARVFSQLGRLIRLRRAQPAFHPNALQFTLHLGDGIFAFRRQSRADSQSILCLHNVSNRPAPLPLAAVNLDESREWRDLVSGQPVDDFHRTLTLAPYQFLWLADTPTATP